MPVTEVRLTRTVFSTGSRLGVKELVIPELIIEIELEVHKWE